MFIFVAILLLAQTACSSMLQVQKEKMTGIKKVAIIGLTVQEELPNDLVIQIGGGKTVTAQKDYEDHRGVWDQPKEDAHADKIYDSLSAALGKELGATVIPRDKVVSLQFYKDVENAQHFCMVNETPRMNVEQRFGAHGIVGSTKALCWNAEDHAALAAALGVDALAVAKTTVQLNRNDSLSIGSFSVGSYSPTADTEFHLFNKTGEEVWLDRFASSKTSVKGPTQISGITAYEPLHESIAQAAALSFGTLTNRFHNNNPEL